MSMGFLLWFPESATSYKIFYPVYFWGINPQYSITWKIISVCVCECVFKFGYKPEILFLVVATEPSDNGSEIKLSLQQLDGQ